MATLPPSVLVLLDDRAEARELADDLATMLDELIRDPHEPRVDRLEMAAALVQRWHERTWAPDADPQGDD